MDNTRFTRARKVSVTKNYGTYTLDYTIPNNKEFKVHSLFANCTTPCIFELQYSDDGGTTWVNPWDTSSTHLLWILLGAGLPGSSAVDYTWFLGDGTNTKVRIKITNTSTDTDATAFFLIKALERDV